MKVFDCVIFNNELDLLEIRMHELDDSVDYFVIVEASRTFSGLEKPLHFADNRARYAPFERKVLHVPVYDLPIDPSRWGAEHAQRDAILRGLKDFARPNDYVMCSDADEIPDKNRFPDTGSFRQNLYLYYLNRYLNSGWSGTTACRYEEMLAGETPQLQRGRTYLRTPIRGGWHFSYLGGVERMRQKLEAFSELDYDTEVWKQRIAVAMESRDDFLGRGHLQKVPIDASFPQFLQQNWQRYPHLIDTAP